MSDQRWTAETLELVASRGAGSCADILDALYEVGLLLPPGGETHQEAEVEYRRVGRTRGGVEEKTYRGWDPDYRAREFEAALECGHEVIGERVRTVVDWPDGTKLTGPWIPYDPAPPNPAPVERGPAHDPPPGLP